MSPAAPTTEIGQASSTWTLPSWGGISPAVDEREYAPDVRWPQSVQTFERMETDAHLAGLLLGTTLAIRRRRWQIDPNGASDQVAEACARDFGLPLIGAEEPPSTGRERNRFNHDRHLAHALRALVYGHYFFEQVGTIVGEGSAMRWQLRKLAPRPPRTIADGGTINVAKDGGLISIQQGAGLGQKAIPVERLVAYVWGQEGADWFGRSLLRPCFRNWARKDRLLRVDAMAKDRNGMGVPWFETDPSLTKPQVDALAQTAQRMRSGDQAGGAGPGKLLIKGVDGTLPDTIASIEYDDRQMSMAFLSMFADLGRNSANGARSLGDTFVDLHVQAQDAIADWYAGITTEHAVWDWCDWNFGDSDTGAPRIVSERSEDPELAVADLVSLVNAGVIAVDGDLENAIRGRYQLPERDPNAPAAPVQMSAKRRGLAAAATVPVNRDTREPNAIEMAAQVDFERMDAEYVSARDSLVAKVRATQPAQIEELRSQIEDSGGDVAKLAAIACAPAAAAVIADAMKAIHAQGVAAATAEATAQGLVDPVAPPSADAALAARAAATDATLARSLSDAAARKALQMSGGTLTPADIADEVSTHLGELTDSFLEQELGAALVEAQNGGRKAVMRANVPDQIYASALLDVNTCEVCAEWDGEGFETLDEAEAQLPAGNKDCLGGPRCRCTLVGIWQRANA